MRAPVALFAFVLVAASAGVSSAQQAVAWIHNQGLNDSFFEGVNVGFGFNIPGGGGVVGLQPNGQFTPNGAIQFRQNNDPGNPLGLGAGGNPATAGVALHGQGGDLFFGISADQGSSRSMSSGSAGVTVINGGTGSISDTSQRPFVTGLVPVVGEFNHLPVFPGSIGGGYSPLVERVARLQAGGVPAKASAAETAKADTASVAAGGGGLAAGAQSSAARGDVSVAEIRAQQNAEKNSQAKALAEYEQRALAAEEAGKPGVARIYYRMAADRASGAERQRLLAKVAALESAGSTAR